MYVPRSGDLGTQPLRAPRANRVFHTDEKRIRMENTVIVNDKDGAGVLCKIVDCKGVELSFFT